MAASRRGMIPVHFTTSIRADTDQSLRKKKSSKPRDNEKSTEHERKDPVEEPERIRSDSPVGSSGRNSPAASSSQPDRKTPAEKRFEETQRKRVSPFLKLCAGVPFLLTLPRQLLEKVAKQAHMTHKDRVHEFNSKLEALSEHHDIPKVCGLNPLVRAQANGVFPHRLDPDNDRRHPCLVSCWNLSQARLHAFTWSYIRVSTVNYNHEQHTGRAHKPLRDPVFIFGSPRV
jgi:protein FAM32A